MEKIAVGVGYFFNLFDEKEVAHIDLNETGIVVQVDGKIYNVNKGTTFSDSRKVDMLLDNKKEELRINDYRKKVE